MKPHVNSEKRAWLLHTDLGYLPEKNLSELQTELGVKLTLMLGDKREAQTAGVRQVLMKDFKMEGIHSCWWEGLEELNLQIIALLQEWEKKFTHYYKSIIEPFKHIESFSENMPSVALRSHRDFFFQLCSFIIQFSLLSYLLFNGIIHI